MNLLPTAVHAQIFQYFDQAECARFARCCRLLTLAGRLPQSWPLCVVLGPIHATVLQVKSSRTSAEQGFVAGDDSALVAAAFARWRPLRLRAFNVPELCDNVCVMSCILKYTQLTELTLDCCGSDQSQLELMCQNLLRLRMLNLAWSEIRDATCMSSLPELTDLNMDYCRHITTVDALPRLPQLQSLSVVRSTHSPTLSRLTTLQLNFPNLTALTVNGGGGLRWLRKFVYLSSLRLREYLQLGSLRALIRQLPQSVTYIEYPTLDVEGSQPHARTVLAFRERGITFERFARTLPP